MKEALVERLKEEIRYEFSREGPPEGFPKFPDIVIENNFNKSISILSKELINKIKKIL